MAFKFEITNNAIQITNTSDSSVFAYLPNRDIWFDEKQLKNKKWAVRKPKGFFRWEVVKIFESRLKAKKWIQNKL